MAGLNRIQINILKEDFPKHVTIQRKNGSLTSVSAFFVSLIGAAGEKLNLFVDPGKYANFPVLIFLKGTMMLQMMNS